MRQYTAGETDDYKSNKVVVGRHCFYYFTEITAIIPMKHTF